MHLRVRGTDLTVRGSIRMAKMMDFGQSYIDER